MTLVSAYLNRICFLNRKRLCWRGIAAGDAETNDSGGNDTASIHNVSPFVSRRRCVAVGAANCATFAVEDQTKRVLLRIPNKGRSTLQSASLRASRTHPSHT